MGVAAILRHIRSSQDKEGRKYRIAQTSVYQILADHRNEQATLIRGGLKRPPHSSGSS